MPNFEDAHDCESIELINNIDADEKAEFDAKQESCNCEYCQRSKAFKKYLESVQDEEAREFFVEIYSELDEKEEIIAMHHCYFQNLRNLYPKIYKECRTLEQLKPENAQFPEKII